MRSAILAAILLCAPLAALPADDLKVSQLDQDIRDLRRQVQEQQRQIDALRAQLVRPTTSAPPKPPAGAAADANSNAWVDSSRWQRIRPGMSELDVVNVLGKPTSMRMQDGARMLLYAMEIGSSGFLGGSVTFRDGVVTQVQSPVLK